jgi:arylsulfatase A-like enzyme/Tfp pilus assembly protein PilF
MAPPRPPRSRRRPNPAPLLAASGLAGAAAILLWQFWPTAPLIVRTADQNVLLVTIDTLRADALGCYGGRAATPHLDELARGGVRFDFAHAHAVMTLPAHASILTGLYPFAHGVHDNSGYRLDPARRTLAARLRDHGFATAAFVGAFPLDSRFGLDQGFDLYDDRLGEAQGPSDFTIPERRADQVVAAARAWLATQTDRWFVWAHLFDPHAAYDPPPPFDSRYAGDPYHGEVAYVDAALGSLFDILRAGTRPTLVAVTGDHGEALGDHGELTHGLFAYEATLRVPLILAQVPARGAAGARSTRGRVVSAPARHIDLVPTVLDALDLPVPSELPGRSLLPLVESRGWWGDRDESSSYFEALSANLNRGWAPLRGLLVGRAKFIDLPLPELYDLAADPLEQRNLADRQPERLRVLAARLRALAAAPADRRGPVDSDVAARLRALGYVTGEAPRKTRYTEADDPKRLVDLDRAIHEAIDRFQRGRPREAAELYRRILGRRPDLELAYRHLAFVAWSVGAVQEAVGTLKRALEAGIGSPALVTQLATYLAESGAPEDAVALVAPLAARPDADVDTLNALGIAYARAGRGDRAIEIFRRMLARDPDNAMALENIGAVHLTRGELAAARAAFERAVALAPRSSRAHAGVGVVRLKSGDRAGAIEAWRRAVELDPQNYDALYNLATELAEAGRLEEARPYLERFVRDAPPAFYAADIRRLAALLGRQP